MDAKVSKTMTGIKRVLRKVVDPLFSRANPSFGLDKGRIFSHKRQP
jgi:hypothetical protein